MDDPKTASKVCAWATEVERLAENQGLVVDSTMELFLEIDENNCSYYLVDRVTATIFWLSEYNTTELGLQSVITDSHLSKYAHCMRIRDNEQFYQNYYSKHNIGAI